MKRRLPPGPDDLGVSRLGETISNKFQLFENLRKNFGDIVYYRVLRFRYCLLSDPDLIREVHVAKRASFHKAPFQKNMLIFSNPTSVTADGQDHVRQRKLIQSSFRHARIMEYAREMNVEIKALQDKWRGGETYDFAHEMHKLALSIVSATFFGRDLDMPTSLTEDTMKTLQWTGMLMILPFGLGKVVAKLPLPGNRFRERTCKAMDKLIYQVIEKARNDEDRTDLISQLTRATDEEGNERPLSDEEVRDEAYVMIMAGHETSANSLAWTFYHLSQNPAVLQRLEAEVDETLGGQPPTPDDYKRLPYTLAVFMESLRVAAPTYCGMRRAIEDCEIGDYLIPKNTIVYLFWRGAHMNEKYFPRASEFRPERWLEDAPEGQQQDDAYFPFGGGLRKCPGATFAKMEAVLAIAAIVQNWRITPVSDEYPAVSTLAFYRFKEGLPVTIEKRNTATQKTQGHLKN